MATTEPAFFAQVATYVTQVSAIVVGWVVVHKLSAQRDRDKARREMIAKSSDALADDCKKILIMAYKYHSSDRDISHEIAIKMSLQDLSLRIETLSQLTHAEKLLAPCRSAVRAFRRAISGTHFEDEHLMPLLGSNEQLQVIASEGLRVQQALLNLKHAQFAKE